MVTLNITGAWIHLTNRVGTRMQIPVAAITETSNARGMVRQYAGGGRRSVTAPGTVNVLSLTLVWVPRSTINTLLDWVGDVVVYRDQLSKVVYGQLTNISLTESPEASDNIVSAATLTVTPTTETAEII